MDKKKLLFLFVGLLIILAAIAGGIWRRQESGEKDIPADDSRFFYSAPLALSHSYKNKAHTFQGSLTTPTPCYIVSTDAAVAESYPEQISLMITVQKEAGVCAQRIDKKNFTVVVPASERARLVRVEINGSPAEFTLLEK